MATKVTRSTAGLRDMLFATLEGVINGGVSNEDALTRVKISNAILGTVQKDIEAMKLLAEFKGSPDHTPAGTVRTVADLNLNIALTQIGGK
jgi:hypothetical protein